MQLAVVGVSHHTAPVEIREKMAFSPPEASRGLVRLREEEEVAEAVLLSTCNRTEVYFTPAGDQRIRAGVERLLAGRAGPLDRPVGDYLFERRGEAAVRHLFQVCSGLDSLVTGEAEIQGQVRAAYERAAGLPADPPMTGPVLNRLFQTALAVGGRVRSETTIGEGSASVASVAVELAGKIFGSLRGRRVLVLGAGKTGELVVRALSRAGVGEVTVVNRTYERATRLAGSVGGDALPFDRRAEGLADSDIVLCSTAAPHPVLTRALFDRAFPNGLPRPLLMIDLAVPRDVDPAIGGVSEVFLYNVDDLRKIVDERVRLREGSLPEADRIVREGCEDFRVWYASLEAVPVIRDMRRRAERHRDRELDRLLQGLEHLSEGDRERVEEFSRRLVNKLLHDPTARLRKGLGERRGAELVEAARFLYGVGEPSTPRDGTGNRSAGTGNEESAAEGGGPTEDEE